MLPPYSPKDAKYFLAKAFFSFFLPFVSAQGVRPSQCLVSTFSPSALSSGYFVSKCETRVHNPSSRWHEKKGNNPLRSWRVVVLPLLPAVWAAVLVSSVVCKALCWFFCPGETSSKGNYFWRIMVLQLLWRKEESAVFSLPRTVWWVFWSKKHFAWVVKYGRAFAFTLKCVSRWDTIYPHQLLSPPLFSILIPTNHTTLSSNRFGCCSSSSQWSLSFAIYCVSLYETFCGIGRLTTY